MSHVPMLPRNRRMPNASAIGWLLGALLTTTALGCSSSHGNGAEGSVFVEVRNPFGELVEGVSISTDPISEEAETDETGTAILTDVKVGAYRVLARHRRLGKGTAAVQVAAGVISNVTLVLDGIGGAPDEDGGFGGSNNGEDVGGWNDPEDEYDAGKPVVEPPDEPGSYIDVGTQVEAMIIDPARPYLYALDKVNNSLLFISTNSKKVVKTIFVGSSPVDMDISLDGKEMFIANFGSTEISVIDLETQEVGRSMFVQTNVGTWDGNPYRLAALAFGTLAFTSEDQWNDIKLVRSSDGFGIVAAGSVYQPDVVRSPDGTHLYVAESGSTGSGLKRFDVTATGLTQVDESSDASGYGSRLAVVTSDGKYVFYAGQKFLATNLKSVLGTFGEPILAANSDGTLAIGGMHIYNGNTFAIRRPLPRPATVVAFDEAAKMLYLYALEKSRIYLHDMSDL